jgi:hypothetical protein
MVLRMRLKTLLLVSGIAVMSFISGFYVALYIENKVSVLGLAGNVMAVFAPIGVLVTVWKLVADWYSIPKIIFGQIRRNNEPAYHVRIEKTRGRGKAMNCEAFITIEHTPIQDSASVWSLDAKRLENIGGHHDLRIFRVEGDSIFFPMWIEDGKFSENSYHLNDFMDRKPIIRVYSDNASGPDKFDKTVRQIIEEGDKNFNVL